MADEESEIRRMAEIADAINAILDADPVGDTPAEGASGPRPTAPTPEAAPQDNAGTPSAADMPPRLRIIWPMIWTPRLLPKWEQI